MTTTYETGHSRVTGRYFVISHDGLYGYGEYESLDEAEDRVRELEQEPQDDPKG